MLVNNNNNNVVVANNLSDDVGEHEQKKKKKDKVDSSNLSQDQFRTALEMVVTPGDPREYLVNYVQIGEGSTGVVFLADHKLLKQKVATF